ncbi:MAG: hypothetical protein AB7C91_07380 [Sphaerochaeta sp.]|jgi:hypothetical protein|uniref:hypothetical protein n=1 Tax=Sphaerochaeta sp. TaxID=1972642 RepID=UPI002FC581A2
MKQTMKVLIIALLLSAGVLTTLSARDKSIAVGAQIGFTSTGVIADIGLGSMYVQAGINYPLGITYIAAQTDSKDKFFDIYTFNADVSQAFALSDNFDLKVGIGTTAFTNFGPVVIGFAGPVLKGEYWIPNKNTGLFLNLNIPLIAYGFVEGDTNFDGGIVYNPLLPLVGLVTSTVGVLYSF